MIMWGCCEAARVPSRHSSLSVRQMNSTARSSASAISIIMSIGAMSVSASAASSAIERPIRFWLAGDFAS